MVGGGDAHAQGLGTVKTTQLGGGTSGAEKIGERGTADRARRNNVVPTARVINEILLLL